MGKLPNGYSGPLKGKLGNAIGYILNGENVIRTIAERDKKKDSEMTAQRMTVNLTTKLLSPVKEFIKFGYAPAAKKQLTWNYHNAACHTIQKLISGTFPDLYFNYSKVLFACGELPLPDDLAVVLVEEGLKFTWDTSKPEKPATENDHVMVLAYYPETGRADFIRCGSRRSAGLEILEPKGARKNTIMELYIAFISDDQSRVSNSVHLGQFKWPG